MSMNNSIEAMVASARRRGTLGQQCEHVDFGACARCRGRVPLLSGETDKALQPLGLIDFGNYSKPPVHAPIKIRYSR